MRLPAGCWRGGPAAAACPATSALPTASMMMLPRSLQRVGGGRCLFVMRKVGMLVRDWVVPLAGVSLHRARCRRAGTGMMEC